VDGEATDKAGSLNLKLEQMPLQWVQPYIEAHFKPQLSAMLGADARISWGEGNVVAEVTELTADKLQLQDKQAPVNIEQIKVSGVQVDLAARQVQVQAIAVQKPQLAAMRDAQGHWMYERWLPVAAPAAKPATQGGKAEPGKPWSVKLAAIAVDGGALQFRDAAPVQGGNARPVQLDVSALRVRLGAFEPLAAKAAPTPLEVSAQLAASRRVQAGHIQFNGQLGLAPVSAQVSCRPVPCRCMRWSRTSVTSSMWIWCVPTATSGASLTIWPMPRGRSCLCWAMWSSTTCAYAPRLRLRCRSRWASPVPPRVR
jgi:hypothetical protein